MFDRGGGRVAIVVVEKAELVSLQGTFINAPHIDAVAVRMRARHVKRFHAAMRAEQMPRGTGIEAVFGERILALQQPETRGWHDQMHEARHAADRAVALLHLRSRWRVHFETHAAAVAAAAVGDDFCHAMHRTSDTSGPPAGTLG